MWPFDNILRNRIRDLERTVEILTGANGVLTQTLERAIIDKDQLLNKLFEITGLNSSSLPRSESSGTARIQVGRKGVTWPQVKENLELKAREEYWAKKEAERFKDKETPIEELEKEILEG